MADPAGIVATPVTSVEDWDGRSVEVLPPGKSTPKISVGTALATCTTGQSVCGPTDIAPTVRLGIGTAYGAGTAAADGSLIPLFDHVLVYELIWRGIVCVTSGDEAGAAPAPGSTTIGTCTMVSWVDAATGRALYTISGAGL